MIKQTNKYEDVDWTKQDIVISRELGVSREAVRLHRLKSGLAKSPKHKRHTTFKHYNYIDLLEKNKDKLQNKTFKEIRKILPWFDKIPARTQYYLLRKVGIRMSANRLYWKYINFDLPNIIISEIWGYSNHYVSRYRLKNKIGPPKWHVYFRFGRDNLELIKAIAEEKNKVAQLKNEI